LTRSFVTGGSGFIGGALVSRLAERGDEVVALAALAEAAARSPAAGARSSAATSSTRTPARRHGGLRRGLPRRRG
jgi:uncharacterized protein YbjT (DUF2867 family)